MQIVNSTRIEKPGAYRMPSDTYHRDPVVPAPSLSSGLARLMLDASPLHVWTGHPKLNPAWQPDDPSRRLSLGSVAHRILLGAGAAFRVLPFDDYKKKDAQAARDAAFDAGLVPILAAQHALALEIAEAATGQLPAGLLEDGDAEVVVAAQDGPAWLRAQLDWWSSDRIVAVDYKTTSGLASEGAFVSQLARMGYDVQAAFYLRVIARAFPDLAGRVRFLFIAQEIEPPYALATYELSQADLFVAERKVDVAIDRWIECLREDTWPGYAPGVTRVSLPEWHTRKWLDTEISDGDSNKREGDWAFAGGR